LASGILRNPARVEVARRNATADGIEQVVYLVDKASKRELLSHLIGAGNWSQVLVFTRTKHGANRLARQLEQDGLDSAAIHGNKSQAARTRALADFKSGKVRVLVATDIAARGLDIDQLPHVVNYELPNVPEDYVHRIGRTGRAGSEGTAVSLVCDEERDDLRAIERLLKREIGKEVASGYGARPAQSRHEQAARSTARRSPADHGPHPAVQRSAAPASPRVGRTRHYAPSRRGGPSRVIRARG
jgi:ATP-dependent RNA helicase RhlE